MTAITVEKDTTVGVVAAIAALSFLLSLLAAANNNEALAASGALVFAGAAIATVWATKRA